MTDDIVTRLEAALNSQAASAGACPPVLDEPRDRHRHAVDEPIVIAPTPLRTSRRRPGVAIGSAIVGVAAVAAATIAFTDVGSTSGHSTTATVKAGTPVTSAPVAAPAAPTPVGATAGRELLARAASGRAAAGDPTIPAGHFLLQKTVSAAAPIIYAGKKTRTVNPPAGAYILDRTWRPADQSDVWTRQQQTVGFPAEGSGKSRWAGVCDDLYRNTQDPPVGSGCSRPGGFDDISPNFVATLPRDPSTLYKQIRTYAKTQVNPEKVHNVDGIMLATIDGLLYSDAVPADLASSLIRVLALVPSEHVVRNVTTFAGRTGLGVQVLGVGGSGHGALPLVSGIILDPKTGAYLGDYSGRPGSKKYGASDVTLSVVDRVPAGH